MTQTAWSEAVEGVLYMKVIDGGVTAPIGYQAAGIQAGIKKDKTVSYTHLDVYKRQPLRLTGKK